MIDQEKIHKQCLDENWDVRYKAAKDLDSAFIYVPDKQQAWNDLHKLVTDEKSNVRYWAASTLGSIFSEVPDKQQAWNDLHKLTNDKSTEVRFKATLSLGFTFSDLPDKQQAWNDLHKLTNDENSDVRRGASFDFGAAFSDLPDKQQAWNDLHKLTNDEDSRVRSEVTSAIGSVFSDLPNKQQAWNDLHKLTNDENSDVRYSAASAIGSAYSHVPDKQQAWNDLHKLINDKNSWVRYSAVSAIGSAFSQVPDKQQAWNDLHKLSNDQDNNVRSQANHSLGKVSIFKAFQAEREENYKRELETAIVFFEKATRESYGWNNPAQFCLSFYRSFFSDLPNNQQAWNDLHKLTNDENSDVRYSAASAIGSVFSDLPNKQQAWSDLHKLINDKNSWVRYSAAFAIGSVFSDLPNKQQAWSDLHKLINDKNSWVRYSAVSAIGSAFSQVPDKQQAWNDLHKLINDQDNDVRSQANHSLGKVSIFKASQAEREEDYKKELETAIAFFEKAARESLSWNNPSQFCLPLYRSFHTIVFKKQEAREEVNKYLEEAKSAIEGSQSKKLLFEAVENLANALKEVQDLEKLDLKAKKSELNFYRQYCDRAAELMIEIEVSAPFAIGTMRKGLPILDRNLKELLEEIQKKAKIACQVSQGTPTQEIACSVRREVQKWEISSQEEMSWYVENLIFTLELTIPRTPINQNFFERINQIREEKDIVKQYAIVCTIIPLIPRVSIDEKINNVEQGINDIKKSVGIVNENTTIIIEKLDEIQEELKKGFESLDKLSIKVGGTEGECLKIFSEKLLEITKKGDSETLKHFLEEVLKNEDTLTKEIESSSAPNKEKEEAKRSISKLKSLLKKAKNPAKEFGRNVANEIVVSYTAKGIIEFFLPIMSMAIFGVPIPSQIVNMLANVVTELKNKEVF